MSLWTAFCDVAAQQLAQSYKDDLLKLKRGYDENCENKKWMTTWEYCNISAELGFCLPIFFLQVTGGEGCNSKARALDQVAMRFLVWNWRPPAIFGEGSLTVPQKRAPAELPRLVLVFFFPDMFFGWFFGDCWTIFRWLYRYPVLFYYLGGQILFGGQIYYNMHDPTCCQKPRDCFLGLSTII